MIPVTSDSPSDRMTSLRGGVRVHAVPTLQHALHALSLYPPDRREPRERVAGA